MLKPTAVRHLWRAVPSAMSNPLRPSGTSPTDGRAGIDAALVKRLIACQFPQWINLPVTPVDFDGHDNRTYRVGDAMSVRLPISSQHALAVAKEHEWLPKLAPHLPIPIPSIIALGKPSEGYNHAWSVRDWLDGDTAAREHVRSLRQMAHSLAEFLIALQRIDTTNGPVAGPHSWYRGASLQHYDAEVHGCLEKLERHPEPAPVDLTSLKDVWHAALTAEPHETPVWFHGDVAAGNLLVANGELAAVIDFGTCGVGDPSCDLTVAWTMLSGESREVFRSKIAQEPCTWARARGWALWKSLLLLTGDEVVPASATHITNIRILKDVVEDHVLYGK